MPRTLLEYKGLTISYYDMRPYHTKDEYLGEFKEYKKNLLANPKMLQIIDYREISVPFFVFRYLLTNITKEMREHLFASAVLCKGEVKRNLFKRFLAIFKDGKSFAANSKEEALEALYQRWMASESVPALAREDVHQEQQHD